MCSIEILQPKVKVEESTIRTMVKLSWVCQPRGPRRLSTTRLGCPITALSVCSCFQKTWSTAGWLKLILNDFESRVITTTWKCVYNYMSLLLSLVKVLVWHACTDESCGEEENDKDDADDGEDDVGEVEADPHVPLLPARHHRHLAWWGSQITN